MLYIQPKLHKGGDVREAIWVILIGSAVSSKGRKGEIERSAFGECEGGFGEVAKSGVVTSCNGNCDRLLVVPIMDGITEAL